MPAETISTDHIKDIVKSLHEAHTIEELQTLTSNIWNTIHNSITKLDEAGKNVDSITTNVFETLKNKIKLLEPKIEDNTIKSLFTDLGNSIKDLAAWITDKFHNVGHYLLDLLIKVKNEVVNFGHAYPTLMTVVLASVVFFVVWQIIKNYNNEKEAVAAESENIFKFDDELLNENVLDKLNFVKSLFKADLNVLKNSENETIFTNSIKKLSEETKTRVLRIICTALIVFIIALAIAPEIGFHLSQQDILNSLPHKEMA